MIDKVSNVKINAYQSKNAVSPLRTFNSKQISFEAVLNQQYEEKGKELQLSKHAKERVLERGIDVDTQLMTTLNEAAQAARQKGATNTVLIGQDAAFVVNIPNGIIVTAISAEELKNNVFTNIDSAVLI
ncbi:MAG TPA: flagellar biosynthesis protein [Lachnospiraceae bacterium]|nr:flagellar biosynthesis protein [Lachnospiraceae bacterium]